MITITIDGGAGTGKGTTAKGVAKVLGYSYIDTGAMYRGVALQVLEDGSDPKNESAVVSSAKKLQFGFIYNSDTDNFDLLINSINKEQEIRTQPVADIVSIVAQYPDVRAHLISQQQALGNAGGVIFDGRDCGTIIAPKAELKIHLVCDLDVRVKRRQEQYSSQGKEVAIETIKKNLHERDQKDLYGPNATSSIATNAIDLDTTHLSVEEQINEIIKIVNNT